jgi:hypothetical protein
MVPDAAGWRDRLGRASGRELWTAYFLLRRWMRVFFSSLRCFFFAILLRRFLITEPTKQPSLELYGRRPRTVPAPNEGGRAIDPV